jgi:hypothetical protein
MSIDCIEIQKILTCKAKLVHPVDGSDGVSSSSDAIGFGASSLPPEGVAVISIHKCHPIASILDLRSETSFNSYISSAGVANFRLLVGIFFVRNDGNASVSYLLHGTTLPS